MKINKKQFNKWIQALRSGKYKQTKTKLQDEKGYCCLGVACHVLNKSNTLNSSGYLWGFTPDFQKESPSWLVSINNDFFMKTDFNKLANLNDELDYSFDEIADCLELVYVHKALGE